MAGINSTAKANLANLTQQADDSIFNFTSAGPIYQLHDDAKDSDIQDQLRARLMQLDAMLSMIVGEGFENFSSQADTFQMNYIWGCSMIARECQELAFSRVPNTEGQNE